MPPHTIGYVYLPALLAIVAASVISAPIGRARGASLAGENAEACVRVRALLRSPPTCCGSRSALAALIDAPRTCPQCVALPAATIRSAARRAGESAPNFSCRHEYFSRSTFFCTLPIALRGRSATKCTRFGTLKLAISRLERGDHRGLGRARGRAARRRPPRPPRRNRRRARRSPRDSTTPGSASMRSSISFG